MALEVGRRLGGMQRVDPEVVDLDGEQGKRRRNGVRFPEPRVDLGEAVEVLEDGCVLASLAGRSNTRDRTKRYASPWEIQTFCFRSGPLTWMWGVAELMPPGFRPRNRGLGTTPPTSTSQSSSPERVITLATAPVTRPYSAEYGSVYTWTASIALIGSSTANSPVRGSVTFDPLTSSML